MSVYTAIDTDELNAFLSHYDVGELVSFEGISAGIENTNYFVTTQKNGQQNQYVLTIFEALGFDELPYFLDLMAHFNEHAVPSAHPIANEQGKYLLTLKDKPAALVQRLSGKSVESPTPVHCAALGAAMGHYHVVSQSFTPTRENRRGPHWWHITSTAVMPHLSVEQQTLLTTELAEQDAHQHDELPRGVIHADLFRDNALCEGDRLTGIIDFYYACNDVLLYDVAVAMNDWCVNDDGSLDEARSVAFLRSYQDQRTLNDAETASWPLMMRAAALRFWLSRLHDTHFPREGELTHIKDPQVFQRILEQRRASADKLIELLQK